MKWILLSLVPALLLVGCATGTVRSDKNALYEKFDGHCRQHARQMGGEADEHARYHECMSYFLKHDIDCPYCVLAPQVKTEK